MQLSGKALDFDTKTTVGLRFSGVAIPRGAKITAAYLEFRAIVPSSGQLKLTVRGNDADSASAFGSSARNLSSRTKTSASSTWQPRSWSTNQITRSSELKDIVQEIVNRGGWQSGNALAFTITGSGSASRAAMSLNKSQAYAPTLVVSYGGGNVTPPPSSGSTSQRVWLSRLRSSLDSGRYRTVNSKFELDPDYIAASGDSYLVGRFGNMLETSYVLAYRETGDRQLMSYVDKFMNQLKGAVADHNRDGFRDILFKQEGPYYHTDEQKMDEMLSHGTIAALTLALKQAGYSSTASWWITYLKNDFVPKWEKRVTKLHPLTHPRANFIRYYYAMYKLTGDGSYLGKARSEAATLKRTIRTDGWAHFFGRSSGCQPMVYVPLTSIALADLATNGSGLIDNATMQRASRVVATKIMNNTSGTSVAADACGNGSKGGVGSIATFSFTPMAAWDGSGRIESISERVYNATERYNLNTPVRTPLPAALTFVKGR